MNRQTIAIAIGIFVVLLIAFIFVQRVVLGHKTTTVTLGGQKVKLEIVTSQKDQEIGLSKKKSLPDDQGMVFVFSKSDFYPFWMKEMKFPIDIIYLDNASIVTIYKNVPAPKDANAQLPIYNSTQPANRVIELNAGSADKYHLENGQTIDLSL